MKTKHDFLNSIIKKNYQSLYILEGDERYLKQEAVKFAVDKMISSDLRMLNLMYFENPKLQDLVEAAQMFPVMSERRMIVVEGFSLLESSRSKGGNTQDAEAFIRFVKEIPDTTTIIITFDGKADSRKNTTKACAQHIYTFERFKKEEAVQWILAQTKKSKKTMDRQTAEKLNLAVGNDAAVLRNELDKLIAYSDDRDEITSDAVDAVASKSISYSVFNMTDALLGGEVKRALEILKSLIKNGENEYLLFAMLVRECRINYYIKALHLQRKNQEEIAAISDTRSFAIQKRLSVLARMKLNQLWAAYQYCMDTELAVKEGKMSQEGLAERVLVGIFTVLYPE